MAEEKKRKSAPGRPEKGKTDRTKREKPSGDDAGARDREKGRKKRSGKGGKVKRFLLLLVLLVLAAGGWLLSKVGWDPTQLDSYEKVEEATRKGAADDLNALAKIDFGKLRGDMDDWFKKNPKAKKFESFAEMEAAHEEADKVEEAQQPPPSEAPGDPAPRPAPPRSEAKAERDAAKAILKTFSPGDDAKLESAMKHLDKALKLAEAEGNESLATQIQEMRYFCIKMHSTK